MAANEQPRRVADHETIRFARAILNRPYKFTIILLVANFFVFLLMWQSSGMSFSVLGLFPHDVLVGYGAKLNSLIDQHQWWRLVTPMFLHVNLLHLMVNMYSLWILGPYVEKLYGSAKFTVFWVLSGVAGVVASYLTVVDPVTPVGTLGRFLLKTNDEPSAGASGALFGLVGVLFVFGIKYRRELPEGFKRAFGTGLLPMIMLNLFIGYVGRGFIDNAAHLGGLVAGAAMAAVVDYRRPGERSSVAVIWKVLQGTAIVLVLVSFVKVVQHFPPRETLRIQTIPRPSNKSLDAAKYFAAMNGAQEALVSALVDKDVSKVDATVTTLQAVPSLDQTADQLREKLKMMLLEAKDLNASPSPSQAAADAAKKKVREEELGRQFESWSKDYRKWLKTAGKNYG